MIKPPRPTLCAVVLAWVLACGFGPSGTPSATAGEFQVAEGRQVTVFGVLATPGQSKDDPKLKDMLPQLRNLLPNHSFKLIKVESKRLMANESLACDLGAGFVAASQLITPLDPMGKVQLRFDLSVGGISQYQTIVTTPPNQIFYCNRTLPNGERLIIGIGAR